MGRTVDPQEHADGDFRQPPPDVYFVQLEDLELKDNKAGDGQYYNLTCRVLSGVSSGGQYQDCKFWDILSTKESSFWKISSVMVSCGLTSPFDIDNESEVKRLLKGRVGKVQTKFEEYEGVQRCKTQSWLKMEPEERQAFAGNGGGGLPSTAGSRSAAPPASSTVPADDDIPF